MKKYISIAVGLALAVCAAAQNLNPTVQVTNDYEGKFMEVQKMNLQMAVPDSLTQFDWNFNYSVFDNPYKGAYEFNPYLIDMKPAPAPYDGKKLYIRAGAGYSLHPEFQTVWSPDLKKGLKLSVYDSFKGYWGQYHTFDAGEGEALKSNGSRAGNDSGNRFGVSAIYDFKPVVLSLDGNFDWMNSSISEENSNNVFGESVSLRARSKGAGAFSFDIGGGFNNLSGSSEWSLPPFIHTFAPIFIHTHTFAPIEKPLENKFGETGFNAGGSLSYRFSESLRAGISAEYDGLFFHRDLKSKDGGISTGLIDVSPSFTYSVDRFSASAGMKFSNVLRDYWTEDPNVPADEEGDKAGGLRKFFPQAHVSFEVVEDALEFYTDLTGGNRLNPYSSYLESNHFLSGYWLGAYPSWMSASMDAVDVSAGLKGRIKSRFQFDLKGGFAKWSGLPMDGINYSYLIYSPVDMDLLYGELNTFWNSDRLDFSGLFKVQKSTFNNETVAMPLPLFSGSADLVYNWNRRLFAGVSAEWTTGRENIVTVPGWVDLGVNLEYRITGRMSFWIKGGNLLNQVVMRNLLIAEKGPYFTLGACFCM